MPRFGEVPWPVNRWLGLNEALACVRQRTKRVHAGFAELARSVSPRARQQRAPQFLYSFEINEVPACAVPALCFVSLSGQDLGSAWQAH
jgi:hypothetical protein